MFYVKNYKTTQLDVDPKHHRHFILRGAEVLRDIQSNCGNIQISFPKQETGESIVTLRGHKDHVEAAKKRILAIVEELVIFFRYFKGVGVFVSVLKF